MIKRFKEYIIDIKNLSGTNCYLDDNIRPKVKEIINGIELEGIHFLGNGNYHYLSYFFLERISQEFSLVLFDNHTDMQPPTLGDILSCGSWLYYVLKDIKNLKSAYLCGMAKEHIEEVMPINSACKIITETKGIPNDIPLYLSIDADVLSEKYIRTAWDQGSMSPARLARLVEELSNHNIIGMDICGSESLSAFLEICPLS